MDASALVTRVVRGDRRALARTVSLVEQQSPALREIMAGVARWTGRARVIGVTGPPGVGKSTSTSALVTALRARGRRVGVLAVDPSSPFTGGALLGDRVRMQHHATDEDVFIRSMASRGHLGGLSWATPHALRVLDAAGFDTVIVETVGVGQAEVAIAAHADTTVVLVAPGMGDHVQASKAGVLEIADILVVNKADYEGARVTARELRQMVAQAEHATEEWRPPVVTTVAATEEGVAELVERLEEHDHYLRSSGAGLRRRRERARAEIEALAMSAVRTRLAAGREGDRVDALAVEVVAGRIDPYEAADTLLASLAPGEGG